MLNRRAGIELLENDPQAFLLLSHIAFRARRIELLLSRTPLKPNQALIGDYKKTGLTRHQYRRAQATLTKYNLVIFKPISQGTIATLISTDVYDINAEKEQEEPTDFPMKNKEKKPTENQQKTIEQPPDNQCVTNKEPLTNNETIEEREKGNNATSTTSQIAEEVLYSCLQDLQEIKDFQLTDDNKKSLMCYSMDRVSKAIEYASNPRVVIKKDIISTLHWHCKQQHALAPPDGSIAIQANLTPQQTLAFKYNQSLKENGYLKEAEENTQTIPEGRAHILLESRWTTVALSNPLEVLRKDFGESESLIWGLRRKDHEK